VSIGEQALGDLLCLITGGQELGGAHLLAGTRCFVLVLPGAGIGSAGSAGSVLGVGAGPVAGHRRRTRIQQQRDDAGLAAAQLRDEVTARTGGPGGDAGGGADGVFSCVDGGRGPVIVLVTCGGYRKTQAIVVSTCRGQESATILGNVA